MALVRMLRGGQLTLPAEIRKALGIKEGDYLDLRVTNKGDVALKPVTVVDGAEADRQLERILGRVKYIGPKPGPAEDEVMDMIVDETRKLRARMP
jgi:AbrB family looped-hinge helix DNA binding protein